MPATVIDMSGDADDTRKVSIPAQSEGPNDTTPDNDQGDTTDAIDPDAEPDVEDIDGEMELDLDSDPDTSLVGSLSLHMLSEHGIGGVLHLDDAALTQAHQKAHRDLGQAHGISDHRFRPEKALAVALLTCQTPSEPVRASM